MHWMFNVTTDDEGPGAVLIRGLEPDEGIDLMRRHRGGRPDESLTDGPAKLAQALRIDRTVNGVDLCSDPALFIEPGKPAPDKRVGTGPRVGVVGDELARTRPWRFWIDDTSFLANS
jgi:DNA-3-methyladenine glycosylase